MSDLLAVENLRTSFHTHGGVIRAVDRTWTTVVNEAGIALTEA